MSVTISNSEIRCWQLCRRRWYLAYYLGLQPRPELDIPTGVMNVGNQVHLALEGWYGYKLDPLQVLRWSYEDVISRRPEHESQLRKDLDLALAMVEGYLQWAEETAVDAGLEVLATEHEVTHDVALPGGVTVTWRAKLDQLIRRESDGRLLFRDFKTVGAFEKANALLLDQQMRFYAMLQGLLHRDGSKRVDGALYLMLKRSKRTARARGPFYEQVEVLYNKHDLNSTYLRAIAVSEEIMQARRRLSGSLDSQYSGDHHYTMYPNPTDYCTWGCHFFTQCHLMDDGSRWEAAVSAEFTRGEPYRYYSTERIQQVISALS